MGMGKWTCLFLALGLVMSMPAFAAEDIEALIKSGNHQQLELYYLEEAKNLKAKADHWEFLAEYYEKFPHEYTGDIAYVHMHIVNLRALAESTRKAMHEARDLAWRHHSLVRKGS